MKYESVLLLTYDTLGWFSIQVARIITETTK